MRRVWCYMRHQAGRPGNLGINLQRPDGIIQLHLDRETSPWPLAHLFPHVAFRNWGLLLSLSDPKPVQVSDTTLQEPVTQIHHITSRSFSRVVYDASTPRTCHLNIPSLPSPTSSWSLCLFSVSEPSAPRP